MRLRRVKGAEEAVSKNPLCVLNPEGRKGDWHSLFGNARPIHIEIGMGKGRFLATLAKEHPEINYIGIERYESVLLRALQKTEQEAFENLRFLCMDAALLSGVFGSGEIDRIYLNFSDPWPKERHAKRRLTSQAFLNCYRQILSPEGRIELKTDNRNLFEFSLEEIPKSGFRIDAATFDLHRDASMNAGNVMTEYEEKFSSLGHPICKLVASLIRDEGAVTKTIKI